MKYKDSELIGKKFGRLTIKEMFYKKNRRYCRCRCDCGKETETSLSNILYRDTKSCGCLQRKNSKEYNTKHGLWGTPLYFVWGSIVKRCVNKKDKSYKYYGGKGVEVCEEWKNSFLSFFKWACENGYKKGLSIDRIDSNGNYEPVNCRFVDMHFQSANKNPNKNNKSGYTGVAWKEKEKRWEAKINVKGKAIYIGRYKNKKEAVDSRDKYILDHKLFEYPIQEFKQ